MEKTIVVDKNLDTKMYIERLCIKPGESTPINNEHDLFCYVISGYGLMDVQNYGYNLEQETSVFLPKDSELNIINTGDVDLAIVYYGVK